MDLIGQYDFPFVRRHGRRHRPAMPCQLTAIGE